MEKKKFSLSTLLLIISILSIFIITYLCYRMYSKTTNENEKISLLTNQITSIENSITNMQESISTVENAINNTNILLTENTKNSTNSLSNSTNNSNTILNNQTNNNNSISNTNTTKNLLMSEEQAENLIKTKIEKIQDFYFNPLNNFDISDESTTINENNNSKTGYLIKNFTEVIDQYLTGNAKKNFIPFNSIKADGEYYIIEGGGFHSYTGIKSITNINISNTEITAKIISSHIDREGNTNDVSTNIKLTKNGENWFISELDFKIFE